MRKGFYWSQMITGIGVGFIVAALIWISVEQFALDGILFQKDPAIVQNREIVYYDISRLDLQSDYLIMPLVEEQVVQSTATVELIEQSGQGVDMPEDVNPDGTSGVELDDSAVTLPAENPEVIRFIVNYGDTAEDIALRLEKLGIVSGKEFLHLVHVKNLERTLQSGVYKFQKGALVTEVITQLIR